MTTGMTVGALPLFAVSRAMICDRGSGVGSRRCSEVVPSLRTALDTYRFDKKMKQRVIVVQIHEKLLFIQTEINAHEVYTYMTLYMYTYVHVCARV